MKRHGPADTVEPYRLGDAVNLPLGPRKPRCADAKTNVIAQMLHANRNDLANIVGYCTVAGTGEPGDLLRSLNTLAKYSGGLWKSEKQGRFLWKWAAGNDFLRGGNEAVAWAKQTGWYDAKDKRQRILQFILVIPGYGTRDPSKIRYAGTFVLLDGTGVLATASFKVQHAKKGEAAQTVPIAGSAKTRFARDRNVVPPINVDPAGDDAREKAKQLKANEPVIKAIESIPGWEQQEIFRDFHGILLAGGTLSPNMMRVVERNVPLPVMNVGSAEDVQAKMDESDRWFESVFMPVALEMWQRFDQQYYEKQLEEAKRYSRGPEPQKDDTGRTIKQNWARYRAGQDVDFVLSPFSEFDRFIDEKLRFNFVRHYKGARGVDWQRGYLELRPHVTKAIPKLKKGKTPSKTEVVVIRALLALHDRLTGTSSDVVRRWYESW